MRVEARAGLPACRKGRHAADKAVLALIESANSIHDQEWRNDALTVAKEARTAQVSFASMQQSMVKRFGLQRKAMEGLVANGGDLVALVRFDAKSSSEVVSLSKDIDNLGTSAESANRNARDVFSALKGKIGMKEYATKESMMKSEEKSQ
jgi:predicted ester cyclase